MTDAIVSGLFLAAGLAGFCWEQYRLCVVRYRDDHAIADSRPLVRVRDLTSWPEVRR